MTYLYSMGNAAARLRKTLVISLGVAATAMAGCSTDSVLDTLTTTGVGAAGAAGPGGGGAGGGGGAPECVTGETEPCYDGDPELEGVGSCERGVRTCDESGFWGSCDGWGAPVAEICHNGLDDDCDGEAEEDCPPCADGETKTCYDGPVGTEGVGSCHGGTSTCADGDWGPCFDQALPTLEHCPAIDDLDCDGEMNDTCDAGACSLGYRPSSCTVIAVEPITAPASTCQLTMPPVDSLPCTVDSPGTAYYLSASGDDAQDGLSPATPWRTFCHALANVPAGNTLHVAEGTYGYDWLLLDHGITVKGGYDTTFTDWDPHAHPSYFTGKLSLNHGDAVWAGFYMVSQAPAQLDGEREQYHQLRAGSLVRNYIQLDYVGDEDAFWKYPFLSGICPDETARVACNDIYFSSTVSAPLFEHSQSTNHHGILHYDGNRICSDGLSTLFDGNAPSAFPTYTVLLSNNLLETKGTVADFYGYSGAKTGRVKLVNNTVVGALRITDGYGNGMIWSLVNNIFVGDSGYDVTTSGLIDVAWGNLVFGFNDNTFSPGPNDDQANDVTGAYTATDVFVAPGTDWRPKPGGPAISGAVNVFDNANLGNVTTDLARQPRPDVGVWDRGAFLP